MKKKMLSIEGVHAALFGILREFDRICRTYGLRYTLASGTLLGAVRHKGFIPWDDDVDVSMPRPDYERFLEIASREGGLGEHFLLSKDRGKGATYPFLKLLDDRYPIKCRSHIEVPYLFVDIFPLDGLPDDDKEIRKLYKKERYTAFHLLLSKWYTVNSRWGWLVRVLGIGAYLVGACIGERRSVEKITRLSRRYDFETSKFVGIPAWAEAHHYLPRTIYEEYCELEFEGEKFMAVKEWDVALKRLYHDYMKLPPAKQQVLKHTIRCYPKPEAPVQE